MRAETSARGRAGHLSGGCCPPSGLGSPRKGASTQGVKGKHLPSSSCLPLSNLPAGVNRFWVVRVRAPRHRVGRGGMHGEGLR